MITDYPERRASRTGSDGSPQVPGRQGDSGASNRLRQSELERVRCAREERYRAGRRGEIEWVQGGARRLKQPNKGGRKGAGVASAGAGSGQASGWAGWTCINSRREMRRVSCSKAGSEQWRGGSMGILWASGRATGLKTELAGH